MNLHVDESGLPDPSRRWAADAYDEWARCLTFGPGAPLRPCEG